MFYNSVTCNNAFGKKQFKLNLNWVTKLKLLSIVNIKNIGINFIFSLKATSWIFKKMNSYDVTYIT